LRHGDPALPIRRPHHDGPRRDPASGLDAGAADDDAVVLVQALPALARRRSAAWVGFENYVRFISSSAFWPSVQTTLVIVGGVLVITVVFGILLAMLLDQPMWGQGVVRILVIAPFFVMPTVSALVWKNMFMDPTNGMFRPSVALLRGRPRGLAERRPVQSIILIVSWQWLPFATLILLTAIQSLDSEQLEAAEMDGAPPLRGSGSSCCRTWPRDHHRDPDPDDLPAVDLRRDLRHHRRRLRHPDADLPDLSSASGKPERRVWARRAASTPSSSPTSLRSS
jgi:ABC-type amino acid transport system permease subunit